MMRAVAAARESETLASHRDAAHWRSAALDTYELTYRPESSTLIDLLVPLVTARAGRATSSAPAKPADVPSNWQGAEATTNAYSWRSPRGTLL